MHWEIANAFSAMFKSRRITNEQAQTALDYYFQIKLRLVDVDLKKAIDIAYHYNLYAYDAYILVAAKQYKSKLISLDKRLINAAKQMNIITIEV